jgi:hypothetical protein
MGIPVQLWTCKIGRDNSACTIPHLRGPQPNLLYPLLELVDLSPRVPQLDQLLQGRIELDHLLATLHLVIPVSDVYSLSLEFVLTDNYVAVSNLYSELATRNQVRGASPMMKFHWAVWALRIFLLSVLSLRSTSAKRPALWNV